MPWQNVNDHWRLLNNYRKAILNDLKTQGTIFDLEETFNKVTEKLCTEYGLTVNPGKTESLGTKANVLR